MNSLNYLENIPWEKSVKIDQLLDEIGGSLPSLIKEAEDLLFNFQSCSLLSR